MNASSEALGVVIGLTAAGLIGCGTGPAAGSPGTAAGSPATVAASAGTATASPGVITGMPTASPPGGGTGGEAPPRRRLLTVADDGASVRLRPGQVLTVVLASGGLRWDIPGTSGAAVRRISGSGGYPAYRPAVAVFRALRPGRAWVTSLTDTECLHTQPACGIPQRLWRALIIVRKA